MNSGYKERIVSRFARALEAGVGQQRARAFLTRLIVAQVNLKYMVMFSILLVLPVLVA